MYEFLLEPFVEYAFLKRSLLATLGIALSCSPIGVLLVLRRMSLMGDALSHAVLPGIAIGYLFAGMWLPALTLGGMIAGILIALLGGFIARQTILHEDASFTGFYLLSLASGVLILSLKDGNFHITHLLFGSVLAVDQASLLFIAFTTSVTLVTFALIYRPLIYECFDPTFVKMIRIKGSFYHFLYLGLVVLNLVAACQALGTLMALGIMMLPAVTARLWAKQVWSLILLTASIAVFSSYMGLVLSYHYNWPSGPTIIIVAGGAYLTALLLKALMPSKRYKHSA